MQNEWTRTRSFHEYLLETNEAGWTKMASHPFLASAADGSIADDVFKTWIAQDYLFAEAAMPFISILIAKAPVYLRSTLANSITALVQELELFEEQATVHDVDLTREMSPTCHAYTQFLMTTAYNRPFEVGFTVLYGAEKAYLDSWNYVRSNQRVESRWQTFINNWTNEAFHGYVDWLATTLDALAANKSQPDRDEMEHHFLLTMRYEYCFWDMATTKETWMV